MFLLALACVTPAPGTDSNDSARSDSAGTDDSQSDDSGDTQDTQDEIDPLAPVIETCDAYCYLHQTGDENYQWKIECSVDDPDGVDNIWNGRFEIEYSGARIADDKMACDDAGYCSGSFGETTHEVYCDKADSYMFLVYISDWDEHESAPYKVAGRKG
ncbi:MAG TPA: hypothetical protein QGF58_28025 [Myxococcota bacterium]|nr:hypothetical protein [Myxococcota bacterium]